MKANAQRNKMRAAIREGTRQMEIAEKNGDDKNVLSLAASIDHWAKELLRHAEDNGL